MFFSFIITIGKALMSAPALQVCGLTLLAMFAIICVGVLAWIGYESATILVTGWQDERRRARRRASFRRRYGLHA